MYISIVADLFGGSVEDSDGDLKYHLGTEIYLHNLLYGFCNERGMGTSYLEYKLLQNMTDIRDVVHIDTPLIIGLKQ